MPIRSDDPQLFRAMGWLQSRRSKHGRGWRGTQRAYQLAEKRFRQAQADCLCRSDLMILNYFEQWDGYNPGDPNTDAGGVELNVLTSWQKSAFDKHKLIAYADQI